MAGSYSEALLGFDQAEQELDHFLHAKWGRDKKNIEVAKDNVEYISHLEKAGLSDALIIYRKLSHLTHPSSGTVSIFIEEANNSEWSLVLRTPSARSYVDDFLTTHPDFVSRTLEMALNPPLMVLKILHKFRVFPAIHQLRDVSWRNAVWEQVEELMALTK